MAVSVDNKVVTGASIKKFKEYVDDRLAVAAPVSKDDVNQYIGVDVTKPRNHFDVFDYYGAGGNNSYSWDGRTLTVNGAYYMGFRVPVKSNSYYTMSIKKVSATVYNEVAVYGERSSGMITSISGSNPTTFNVGSRDEIWIFFYSGTANSGTSVFSDIMLVEGTEAYPYIPYVPTLKEGSIVAYGGSETTGYYVRFSNGVQVCWCNVTTTANVNVAWGSGFISSLIEGKNYPIPFISKPFTTVSPTVNETTSAFSIYSVPSTTTKWDGVQLCRLTSATGLAISMKYFAIGRWK